MNKPQERDFDPQDTNPKALTEEQLKEVQGGFNPQPEPPASSLGPIGSNPSNPGSASAPRLRGRSYRR